MGGAAAYGVVLYIVSNAFVKSLLFLTIGWRSVVAGSTLARALRGSVAVHQLARVAWLFGLLALAGAPFVGCFTFGEQGAMQGRNMHGNLMISCTVLAKAGQR